MKLRDIDESQIPSERRDDKEDDDREDRVDGPGGNNKIASN